jgi:hypothetical protein
MMPPVTVFWSKRSGMPGTDAANVATIIILKAPASFPDVAPVAGTMSQ